MRTWNVSREVVLGNSSVKIWLTRVKAEKVGRGRDQPIPRMIRRRRGPKSREKPRVWGPFISRTSSPVYHLPIRCHYFLPPAPLHTTNLTMRAVLHSHFLQRSYFRLYRPLRIIIAFAQFIRLLMLRLLPLISPFLPTMLPTHHLLHHRLRPLHPRSRFRRFLNLRPTGTPPVHHCLRRPTVQIRPLISVSVILSSQERMMMNWMTEGTEWMLMHTPTWTLLWKRWSRASRCSTGRRLERRGNRKLSLGYRNILLSQ
jgi:hypothetical protein